LGWRKLEAAAGERSSRGSAAERQRLDDPAVEHEVVARAHQPERIDPQAQQGLFPPARQQRGQRLRLAGVEIVDEIVVADEVEVAGRAAEGLLDLLERVEARCLLRIGAQIEPAEIDVAGEQAAQLDLEGRDGGQPGADLRSDRGALDAAERADDGGMQPLGALRQQVPGDLAGEASGASCGTGITSEKISAWRPIS
jgi:hypothetical protein